MKAVILAGVAAALIGGPALAEQNETADKPAKEKKVCRSERPTGSYISKRTCHTLAEWKVIDGSNAENARTAMDRARRSDVGGVH